MESLLSLVENDTVILGLEPFHGIVLGESVGESQAAGLVLLVAHVHAGTAEDDIEVHTINTDGRVVLDTQVNVFLDTETKVAILGKVITTQLVFTNLKGSEQPLQREATTSTCLIIES